MVVLVILLELASIFRLIRSGKQKIILSVLFRAKPQSHHIDANRKIYAVVMCIPT